MSVVSVPVLFCKPRTVYARLGADCYDAKRDARTYAGASPVVAHPPCRAWGRLRTFAKPRHDERELAMFAVDTVRRCGGVLEHPASSTLWPVAGLPLPGARDPWGGFTVPVLQSWWGHRAPKPTWLYVVGIEPRELPSMPYALGIPDGRIERMGRSEREATPEALAVWLLDLARRCRK